MDVDVRGWMYSPHRGPISRKNRIMIGLARKLSGIPAPQPATRSSSPDAPTSLRAKHDEHERKREQEAIAAEENRILGIGEAEQRAAARGKYSEKPRDSDEESIYNEVSHFRTTWIITSSHNPPPGKLMFTRPSSLSTNR